MRVRLLNSIQVLHGEGPPAPLRHNLRGLLFALLVDSDGGPVPVERLLKLAWEQQPRTRAPLHTAVSRLRGVLGDRVTHHTGPDSYQITAAGAPHLPVSADGHVSVDWYETTQLMRTAAGLHTRDPHAAVLLWEDVLAGWSPATLDTLPATQEMQRLRQRVIDAYLDAAEQLAELRLMFGEHHRLVETMTTLVEDHPRRELLRGAVMTALYRCGRSDDALGLYQAHRTWLAERSRQPGPALRLVHDRILAGDPDLYEVAIPPLPPADQAVIDSGAPHRVQPYTVRMAASMIVDDPHSPDAYSTAVDRAAAARVTAFLPEVPIMAREVQQFGGLCVREAARTVGNHRILELGAPPPSPFSLHRFAQIHCPGGYQVVYVASDVHLCEQLRTRFAKEPGVQVVAGSLRAPDQLLQEEAVRDLLQLDRPPEERETVLVRDGHDLNNTPDAYNPREVYTALLDGAAPGSMLALTNVGVPSTAAAAASIQEATQGSSYVLVPRLAAELAQIVPAGMVLGPQGVADTHAFLADPNPGHREWAHYSLTATIPA
ncbi:BTAD domain-containing putative transcriptional regulator [Spirillospora sp. NPDC029432]|uniref:AfsR/SARP family transcriptional regulator n=1 Tax=Spirillospora sp. NPDC029432 TaxID=3154599 RepID=UPI0034556997